MGLGHGQFNEHVPIDRIKRNVHESDTIILTMDGSSHNYDFFVYILDEHYFTIDVEASENTRLNLSESHDDLPWQFRRELSSQPSPYGLNIIFRKERVHIVIDNILSANFSGTITIQKWGLAPTDFWS